MDCQAAASWLLQVQCEFAQVGQAAFWLALGKIIWVNILLSGDNAVVIALACRGLPPRQRLWGMVLGAGVAVALRIVFTVVIAWLMLLPYLKLIGGIALFYVAAKLLAPDEASDGEVEAAEHLWRAVRVVAIADIVMSLDNVIAIAGAAKGSVLLLVLGLTISVPLIIAGAALIMKLLERLPILVWAGAALLGWIVGEVITSDVAVHGFLLEHMSEATLHRIELAVNVAGAALVIVVGGAWRRSRKLRDAPPEEQTAA